MNRFLVDARLNDSSTSRRVDNSYLQSTSNSFLLFLTVHRNTWCCKCHGWNTCSPCHWALLGLVMSHCYIPHYVYLVQQIVKGGLLHLNFNGRGGQISENFLFLKFWYFHKFSIWNFQIFENFYLKFSYFRNFYNGFSIFIFEIRIFSKYIYSNLWKKRHFRVFR